MLKVNLAVGWLCDDRDGNGGSQRDLIKIE
jgi:hypothetical protein